MIATPELITERLRLRAFAEDDLDFTYRHFSDPDVCRYLYDAEPFTSIEEARELIDLFIGDRQKTGNRWLIELKETGEKIGTCGFHFWSDTNKRCDLGYDLNSAYWGRGLMPEAVKAILDFGFWEMDLNRVQAITSVDNAASVRLLTKLKFKEEGILCDWHCFRGAFYDHYCFSLLARDWISASEKS